MLTLRYKRLCDSNAQLTTYGTVASPNRRSGEWFLLPRDNEECVNLQPKILLFTIHKKKLQSICAVLTFNSQLKKILAFSVKKQISIKLFYLYQRLQCRDNYFFKIKFVFFLYLRLSASWKENDLPLFYVYIYFWYQTDSGVPNTSIYSAVSLASPYYNYL